MNLFHGNVRSLVGVALVIATATAATVAPNRGDDLYTPTQAEWTCVELNAAQGTTASPSAVLSPLDGSPDTIVLRMRYFPGESEVMVETMRLFMKAHFDEYVKKRGWSHLKLQFDVHELG